MLSCGDVFGKGVDNGDDDDDERDAKRFGPGTELLLLKKNAKD